MSTIAFLGLGNMGTPMAANLLSAGHTVTGYDPVGTALAAAAEQGVATAGSTAEAASSADVVITMLPSGRHVLDCYAGVDGVLAAAKPDTLFIDCSTIDVLDARSARQAAGKAEQRAVDAPVSGGVVGATAGTLTFMVGGEEADYRAAQPILSAMGAKTVHCGPSGAGQAAKMCNNMILAVSMIAVSEAFVLGEQLGLSNQALYDVASTASGQCWALTTNCPVPGPVPASPANRDYQAGFSAGLMVKDLGLAQTAAEEYGVPTTLGAAASEIYQQYVAERGPGKDFSAIVTAIRERATTVHQPEA